MKRLFFVFLALVFILSACSPEEPVKENGSYNIFGNIDKDKPSAGNYFIYTPIIDIFTPENAGEVSFLGFDGTKFIMDSGTDKAFLLSYDLLTGESENLTNNLVSILLPFFLTMGIFISSAKKTANFFSFAEIPPEKYLRKSAYIR